MSTVYRKSAKGQHEVETRANRLGPRLRTALILVDGRRTDADLRALIQLEADATLLGLLEGGYIEVVSSLAPAVAPQDGPAATAQPAPAPAAAPRPAPPVAPGVAVNPAALADRRRLAVRHLTDQLGPVAEDIALRIEKTRTWAELRPVLELGRTVLERARGSAAAGRFAAQFLDTPPV